MSYCSCGHDEAAHVGYDAVVARTGGKKALFGCTACLQCQGLRPAVVFHTVIWTETSTNIHFALGLEGALATREAAERVAAAYREFFQADADDGLEQARFARVGIAELPAPDPSLKHPTPRDDVDGIVAEINARTARKRESRLS